MQKKEILYGKILRDNLKEFFCFKGCHKKYNMLLKTVNKSAIFFSMCSF
jgi:hypothetical protein